MSDSAEELKDIDKAVIQFMIRLKMVSSTALVNEIFKKLYIVQYEPEDDTSVPYAEELDSAITRINHSLHELGLVIKKYRKGEELYYIFINTVSDEISKLMTAYSPKDIQAINKLIDTMVRNADNSIDELDASNVITQLTSGSYNRSDSKRLLQSLVRDKWFENDASRYTLSGRLISELSDTLGSQNEEAS